MTILQCRGVGMGCHFLGPSFQIVAVMDSKNLIRKFNFYEEVGSLLLVSGLHKKESIVTFGWPE